jgi:hypothetical protein
MPWNTNTFEYEKPGSYVGDQSVLDPRLSAPAADMAGSILRSLLRACPDLNQSLYRGMNYKYRRMALLATFGHSWNKNIWSRLHAASGDVWMYAISFL